MTNRIHVAVSMMPEDVTALKDLSAKLGMKPSELIREMLYKTQGDVIAQDIILRKFFEENQDKLGKERLLRIMSIRSNLKKAGANPNHDTGAVSSIDQGNHSKYSRIQQAQDYWSEEVERTIEYCRKKCLEDEADGR